MVIQPSHPGWVLDEDKALKTKLSGFSVPNYADGRDIPVAVYFRFPDPEERTRTFPHIAIDLTSITAAPERTHRAMAYTLDYNLENNIAPPGSKLVGDDYPLPWNLIYQLGVYSRQPTHDRHLLLMMYQLFPQQYGNLNMSDIDGTIRRADLVSVVRRDTVDAERKRLYRNIFTISVSSEFFVNQVLAVQEATGVDLTVIPYVNQPAVPA